MLPSYKTSLVWFRRDLRDYDQAALYHALKSSQAVFAVFIFDQDILASLPRDDRRVEFIWHSVLELKIALQQRGGDLLVRQGAAVPTLLALAGQLGVDAVFANHDDEPTAIARDAAVKSGLAAAGIEFYSYKDHVIFERQEVLTQAEKPYTVFTPYSRSWRKKLDSFYCKPYPVAQYWKSLATVEMERMPSLHEIGFQPSNLLTLGIKPGMRGAAERLQDFIQRMSVYHETRDFPAVKGPSYLSVHLRFGTVSIRELVAVAATDLSKGAEVWLNELIWRDFYAQILANFPQVIGHSFKADYENIAFPNPAGHFEAWCEARTGYPLVDAAMRQLNQTGYMHNRLRMITASFLVKDLLVDWRLGEAYFAEKLIDFDLASNNGGWQWAASTGCDAQPYFRIFNPITQSEKFDATGKFIRRYVPELASLPDKLIHAPWLTPPLTQQHLGVMIGTHYPAPIVDHAQSREQALALYGKVKD